MSRADEAYLPVERLGVDDVAYHAIRKRNSEKERVEFHVSARWGKADRRMGQRAALNKRLADRVTGSPGVIGGISQ